jgi:hypothetical protein
VAGCKPEWGRLTNPYQGPRPNQKPSGLACGTPYQTLPDPVLAERNPLGDLVWSPRRLPTLTISSIWPDRRSVVPLPNITSRGVKYTHNDRRNHTLLTHSRGTGIRPIPTEHTQKKVKPHTTHTIGRAYWVKSRWSSPHDHPMLGVRLRTHGRS